jgi:gliding motility-associated lipoprotein GldD
MKRNFSILGLCLVVLIAACGSEDSFVPKPHAYPRMSLPEKSYQIVDFKQAPYSFEIPKYAAIIEDKQNVNKSWYNIHFPMFDATLHLTYYPFSSWAQYDSMVADTRSLVNKHIQKAEDIIEDPLENYNPNLHGLVFHIEGQTASNLNFYATDSARHFLRGALYFNQKTQPDSIAPAFEFLWKDVQHALKTFKWK